MKKTLVDILIDTQKEKKEYFKNWKNYSRRIKEISKEILGEARVLVFGSVIKNKWQPDSDIDILIISKNLPKDFDERAKIRTKIKAEIGLFSPFQIHLATLDEFKGWYQNFIKDKYWRV